jgi:proteic killer suppression protein
VNVQHADRTLERLERDVHFRVKKYGPDMVKAFRRRMAAIRSARDEQDFYGLKSLHYEKLRGNCSHERSMRLNDQFRLILRIEAAPDGRRVVIVSIEDYH